MFLLNYTKCDITQSVLAPPTESNISETSGHRQFDYVSGSVQYMQWSHALQRCLRLEASQVLQMKRGVNQTDTKPYQSNALHPNQLGLGLRKLWFGLGGGKKLK